MCFKCWRKQIQKDECDVSWYKEMVGIVCEMCHSNNGSVFNSSSDRTKFLDYSIQPLCTFLCASCQRFLEPFSCYGFFSTFETFVMSMFAARRFYNAAFLALGIGYLI